jgi:hypothetical protein
MFDLQEGRNFRRAQELVDGLRQWLAASRHNERAISVMELDESLERWEAGNTSGNERLLGDQFLLAAEAEWRNDYIAASETLKPVIDGAILHADQLNTLAAERAGLLTKADQQAKGELPAATPAFDRRRDKLPNSPSNGLLEAGDQTARARLSSMRTRIRGEMHDGLWNGRKISFWGLTAEVRVRELNSYVPLVITRPLADGAIVFKVEQQFANYAPAVQLALFELMDPSTILDLAAMLIYAFDNGLSDDAGRLALKLRNAAEGREADVDAILAAKWKVPIPEGGFPVRDGRVVPE